MKARKIEFKTVQSTDPALAGKFVYRDGIDLIIKASPPDGKGLSSDDILKAVELRSELANSKDALYLSQENYAWLIYKLDAHVRWKVPAEVIADFITFLREAPEVEVAEAKKD